MSDTKAPLVRSGLKFRTPQGFNAIKDGMRARNRLDSATARSADPRKPAWLRAKVAGGERFRQIKRNVEQHRLSTVCEEAHCPNIGECWNNGTATIMLMGSVCTRACRFCAVDTGNPGRWLDREEPANTAEAVELMGLRYVVLTSVDRDDLDDGGAGHYADCIQAIRARNPATAVEALTPDFRGDLAAVDCVLDAGPEVFAQNIETVRRLTHVVRDPRAGYQQTLDVLTHAKHYRPGVLTKTSLMLGLGERPEEIAETMDNLRGIGCDILTLGQYLRPTRHHLPIDRWVTPGDFAEYRRWGLEKGFVEVASGPLVRSSYRADRILDRNNLGLDVGRSPAKSP